MKYKIEHEIPEGYEARIEGNKVVITKAESEGEKIRKTLLETCKGETMEGFLWGDKIPNEAVITWLEERKQAWTEEDEEFVDYVLPRILEPNRWTLEQRAADRKRLEEFINSFRDRYMSVQKQKPSELSEDFLDSFVEWFKKEAEAYEINLPNRNYDIYGFCKGICKYLSKPTTSQGWTDKDEECRNELIEYIEERLGDGTTGQALWKKWHSWLKYLPIGKEEETDSRPFSDFVNKYCLNCGSQRCTREGEWLEGCPLYKTWKTGRDIKFWTSDNNDEK